MKWKSYKKCVLKTQYTKYFYHSSLISIPLLLLYKNKKSGVRSVVKNLHPFPPLLNPIVNIYPHTHLTYIHLLRLHATLLYTTRQYPRLKQPQQQQPRQQRSDIHTLYTYAPGVHAYTIIKPLLDYIRPVGISRACVREMHRPQRGARS